MDRGPAKHLNRPVAGRLRPGAMLECIASTGVQLYKPSSTLVQDALDASHQL
jgi:hypothetical protein